MSFKAATDVSVVVTAGAMCDMWTELTADRAPSWIHYVTDYEAIKMLDTLRPTARAGFKVGRTGQLPRGLHKKQ